MSRATCTVPALQTRERSLRPRSTSITCSARSFSEESSRSTSPSVGSVVPAIGTEAGAAVLAGDEPLGRGADERDPVELEQEEVRRRVDAAERPVDVERRRRRRPLGPLRRDALEDVAGDDVLLHRLDHLDVALAVGRAPDRPGTCRAARGARRCPPRGARDLLGVAGEHLGDAGAVVEAHERVADDQPALREAAAVRRAAAPSARAARRGRRRDSRRSAARAPSPRRSRRCREPAPIHELRPSRPRSTDSRMKLARPASRRRR